MRSIQETVLRSLDGSFAGAWRSRASGRVLKRLEFAPNPGSLVAKTFVPKDLPAKAPLVVVLHGCTQTPEGYDRGTGWSVLAERHSFAVLYPEQQSANNPNSCFNWFEPGDMRRGAGEPASIKSMIDQIVAEHAIDPARIYVTGLSAGAAMAGVMLATYPEVFAGGGLIAGLPYGVAKSMPAAFSRMRCRGRESDAQLADFVRKASNHEGPWPSISIWHGTADTTVVAANADATVAQWRTVHGLRDSEAAKHQLNGHSHRLWRDASGRICVEEYQIIDMGHGTPLDAGSVGSVEVAGAYLIDVGLSSSQLLAASWGIAEERAETASKVIARPISVPKPQKLPPFAAGRPDVQSIIEDALRTAGLMR